MGQKVNPHGLRVGVIKDWDSRWYAKNEQVGDLLVEDQKIRKYLKKTLYSAGIPQIEIERTNGKVTIFLHCAKPGVVIGKGGAEIERIRLQVEKMIGKPTALNIIEVKNPDTNALLVAENIAQQLEQRVGYRRAMKNAMGRAMRGGALGIKVTCSGRLGGREGVDLHGRDPDPDSADHPPDSGHQELQGAARPAPPGSPGWGPPRERRPPWRRLPPGWGPPSERPDL